MKKTLLATLCLAGMSVLPVTAQITTVNKSIADGKGVITAQ